MDNMTHTLYGIALSKTGLNKVSPGATAAILIGANFPDVDIFSICRGSIGYLKYHRGITHSLSGIPLGAAILTAVLVFVHNRWLKRKPAILWWKCFLLASLGVASHVLLDYTNSYGLRLLAPFNYHWFAGDLVFIVDPWILLILCLCLGLPFLFGLINQEIGARRKENRGAVWLCLFLIGGYWAAKAVSHQQALEELRQTVDARDNVVRLAAVPKPLSPFRWEGIVETSESFELREVGWNLVEFNPGSNKKRLYHKTQEDRFIQAVRRGLKAGIFLDFARFPLFTVLPTTEGFQVTASDLRFESLSKRRRSFVLSVELNRELKTRSEEFQF